MVRLRIDSSSSYDTSVVRRACRTKQTHLDREACKYRASGRRLTLQLGPPPVTDDAITMITLLSSLVS